MVVQVVVQVVARHGHTWLNHHTCSSNSSSSSRQVVVVWWV
jgi:hypothetical protein